LALYLKKEEEEVLGTYVIIIKILFLKYFLRKHLAKKIAQNTSILCKN
jgi:hypothetical protein